MTLVNYNYTGNSDEGHLKVCGPLTFQLENSPSESCSLGTDRCISIDDVIA